MKRKFVAVVAIIEGLILLILLADSLSVLPQFDLFGCGGEIYATAQSPDKQLTAYAFQRDCGATTGFTTFVILRGSGEKLDLTDDLVSDEIIFGAKGDYHPKLRWANKDDLQVTFARGDAPVSKDIFDQRIKYWETRIVYQGLN